MQMKKHTFTVDFDPEYKEEAYNDVLDVIWENFSEPVPDDTKDYAWNITLELKEVA